MSKNDREAEKKLVLPKVSILVSLILVLLAILITFQTTFGILNRKYKKALDELGINMTMYEKLAEVDEIYRENYIGEIDEDILTDGIITGYILGTGDRYAYYLNRDDFAEMMNDDSGEMVGIGVRVVYRNGILRVIRVMKDSPAEAAGLLKDDIIVAVDGVDIAEIGFDEAVTRIRGIVDTSSTLTIKRGDETIDTIVTRRYFDEETVTYRQLEADKTIGVIQIVQFDGKTAEQFINACTSLKADGVTKFIFDVRDNPGGDLTSICEVLDFLLPKGPIIHMENASGERETMYSEAGEFEAEMCVLVNASTASAAELFSAALQDYEKAELVGVTTFGKGTAQKVVMLSDGSGFAYSDSAYYPPYSDRYEGIGVIPDHVVEMDEAVKDISLYDITDDEDTQLQYAIKLLNSEE